MVLPFNKRQQIHSRYQMLSPQPLMARTLIECDDKTNESTAPQDGQEYATFMKSLSSNNNWKSQEKLTRPKNKAASAKRSFSPTETSIKSLGKNRKTAQSAPTLSSVLAVNELKKNNEKEHRKQLKVIEDYMLLCKQEERDLKRIEGDIIKKESNLNKTMKTYENDIYYNQRHQESEATIACKEESNNKQHFHIEDEKMTKDRIQRNTAMLQKEKEGSSKCINKVNGLEFRFENIAEAIHQKRNEMDALVKDFENKLKMKEEEEYRLKKEFADLSIELNMEGQKHRLQGKADKETASKVIVRDKMENSRRLNELDERMKMHKDKSNQAERSKRRFSKDLQDVMGVMSQQAREDGRRLKDIKVNLQKNSLNMKESQIKADLLEMERLGKQSEEKVLAVNARRQEIHDMLTQQRKQRNDQTTDEFRMRNFLVNHETKKNDLKDNIQHFQKVVDRHEDTEHSLYGQVRQLESDRRKQEQNVVNLKQELLERQKQNKILLNVTALRCQQEELGLQQRLQREEAHLNKALIEREEKIQSLTKYRGSSKEEKHMLEEQRKNHERLLRIERKTVQKQDRHNYEGVY